MIKRGSMYIHDYIRKHALQCVGVHDSITILPSIEVLKSTEWCSEFEQLMRNRLLVGAFRYFRFNNPKKGDGDLIGGLKKKIQRYEETGNAEYLVDSANYCMLLFLWSKHPNHHFKAQDIHYEDYFNPSK
jgi:hypothetical protein